LTGKEALNRWEQFWDVPREVYLATACIRQRELSAIVSDKKSLTSLQQQLRQNALMTDLEGILKQIAGKVRDLKKQYEQFQERRKGLAQQLHQAQGVAERRRAHRQRLQELEEWIEKATRQIKEIQVPLEQWRSLAKEKEELDQVQAEVERLMQAIETIEQLERDLGWLCKEAGFEGSPEALRASLQQQLEKLRQEKRTISEALQGVEVRRAEGQRQQRLRAGLGIGGVVLLLTGVSLIPFNGLLGGILTGAGVLMLLIALLWRAKGRHEAEQEQPLHQQQARVREQIGQVEARLRECERLLNQREGLLQLHNPDELRRQRSQLAVKADALQTKLYGEPLARALLEVPAEEWLQRERRLQDLQAELNSANEEKLRLEGALEHLLLDQDPDELRLQIEQLDERLGYLQGRIDLLQTTRELLSEANRRYLGDLSPLLQPRIATYLPSLTCGRYTRVQIGDGLSFQIYHPAAGDWLDTDASSSGWSAGTLDQIFFACRLGLLDALTGDRRLPLLLDDPFLYFDEERERAAMELLARVAQQTQVLLFTCRVPKLLPPGAVRMIELPAPSVLPEASQ
jgi:uncharacterized protein YhaN